MNPMATIRVLRSVLLVTGAFLIAACATQPTPTPAHVESRGSLLDRKFEQAARHYRKYLYQGQVVYCRKEKVITSAVPVLQCLRDAELRAQVENFQKRRNAVQPAVTPGTGQGGIGR
jgi:hypothetical protein